MKYFVFCLSTILLLSCSSAVKDQDGNFVFSFDSITYNIGFYSSSCVHVQSFPLGSRLKTHRLVVDTAKILYDKVSYKDFGDSLVFYTDELTVTFDKHKSNFRFVNNRSKRVLLKETEYDSRTFTPAIHGNDSCFEVTHRFVSSSDEALYGLGQYQNGIINYKNNSVKLLQSNMDIVNPFLVSTSGYGILWDNYSSSEFKDSAGVYSFYSEVADVSDYYFMAGENVDDVIAEYRTLTGHAPMFGKWVYGFWQSKERYKSFEELECVVDEYRKRNIPLDNIVQDWEYWGDKPYWNRLCFDKEKFNNPDTVISRLHNDKNVHLMVSVWPGFGPETEVYKELDSIGALYEEKTWAGYKVFDVYNPKARDIVWTYLKNGLYDKGVDAWWADATEPSFREGFTQEKQEEKTKSARNSYIGSLYRYLNTYSLELTKDWYKRFRKETSDKRVFIFTRSAFASQQRYATAVWSGDVSASWENMNKQLVAGLNLSMSGIPYWTSDTGGFFVTERGGDFPEGLDSHEYKELYSRWFQFGAFTPIFRAHGTNVPREVWQFGKPGDIFYENQLKYINLRYSLLPYIYSISYKVTTEGYTMLRGLCMDFKDDKSTYDINNAYMFGPSLLVRPVFHPSSVSNTVHTYLPMYEGKIWYDFWTGELIEGGKEHIKSNEIQNLPLYVKGGSIIPFAKVKQYAMEHPDDELELRIYSGSDASFLLYDDEGDSYRYEDNVCSKVLIEWNENDRILKIGKRNGAYPGMPERIRFSVKLYSPGKSVPIIKDCIYNGDEVNVVFK